MTSVAFDGADSGVRSLFLGVDGGGTKTAVTLTDGDGLVLARHRGAASSWFAGGVSAVEEVIAPGVRTVLDRAGVQAADLTHAFFGIPGHGESTDGDDALDALPPRILGHDRVTTGNDMIPGWAGSLGGRDGVNVIAGTGSMAYGERAGRTARVGGWSELFGDEGSAYWVAARGLNAFSRMADGRMPRGPLYDLLRERTGLREDLALIGLVMHDWQGDRTRIADLAKVVTAAAAAGDAVATDIVRDAAGELAEQVRAVVDRVGTGDAATLVSYSGGLFADDGLRSRFAELVTADGCTLVEPALPPDLGAVVAAMRVAGHPVPEAWTEHDRAA